MPGKLDIMCAVREGLETLHFDSTDSSGREVRWRVWTKAVYTKLCRIGQDQFGCYVCTNRNHVRKAECSEWLYDMTWLEYTSHAVGSPQTNRWLIGAHLVAECEWSSRPKSVGDIEDDFSKLLLARAGVRLMICYEWRERWHHNEIKVAEDLAKHLAGYVQRFNGTQAEDAYLLAVLGRDHGLGKFKFKYFKLGLNGAVAWA